MKIDPRFKAPGVEVIGDVLEIDDLNVDGIADALAADLRDAVASQPRGAWNRTGTLLRGIKARDGVVTVPGDHLTRDPVLAARFAAEVMPGNPTESTRVRAAADEAIEDAIGDGKG